MEREHRLDVRPDRLLRGRDELDMPIGIALRVLPARNAPARRQVAVHEVVRRRLVGDHVRRDRTFDAAPRDLRQRSPPHCRASRPTPACATRTPRRCSRAPRRDSRPADRDSASQGACRCGFAGIRSRASTRPPSSPRAAARRPCRRVPPSGSTCRRDCRRNAAARLRRTFRTCPARCPGCRCRSTSRPSSGRTSSGPCGRAR